MYYLIKRSNTYCNFNVFGNLEIIIKIIHAFVITCHGIYPFSHYNWHLISCHLDIGHASPGIHYNPACPSSHRLYPSFLFYIYFQYMFYIWSTFGNLEIIIKIIHAFVITCHGIYPFSHYNWHLISCHLYIGQSSHRLFKSKYPSFLFYIYFQYMFYIWSTIIQNSSFICVTWV
jgi:hypothetical protein